MNMICMFSLMILLYFTQVCYALAPASQLIRIHNLDDLFLQVKITMVIRDGDTVLYHPQTSDPQLAAETIRKSLVDHGIPEINFVRALITLENYARKVSFYLQLPSMKIDPSMNNPAFYIWASPAFNHVVVNIGNRQLLDRLKNVVHEEDSVMIGVLGHELGHVATHHRLLEATKKIGMNQLAMAHRKVRSKFSEELIRAGYEEVLADILNRAMCGDENYRGYILGITAPMSRAAAKMIIEDMGFPRSSAVFKDINLMAYFHALVRWGAGEDASRSFYHDNMIQFHVTLNQEGPLTMQDYEDLLEYYGLLLQAYTIKFGILLEHRSPVLVWQLEPVDNTKPLGVQNAA